MTAADRKAQSADDHLPHLLRNDFVSCTTVIFPDISTIAAWDPAVAGWRHAGQAAGSGWKCVAAAAVHAPQSSTVGRVEELEVNKKTVAIAVGLVVVLGGCATQSRKQTSEEISQYCAQRMADSHIDPLRDKILIPISVDEPQPIEMLANRQYPTQAERQAILALAEARLACNKFAAERVGLPPSYRTTSQDRITAMLADLYAGEITYGEFAKRMLYIGERDKAAREDLDQAIRDRERWAEIDSAN